MSYPIIEFDPDRSAMIEPSKNHAPLDVSEHCVLCFFHDVVTKVVEQHKPRVVTELNWEDGTHRVYEIEHQGKRLVFAHPGVGCALATGILEVVIATGCTKIVACGGCGVLDPQIGLGHLVCVSSAVRDEGTSYHYLPPSREVAANPLAVRTIAETMEARGVPFSTGKTWTTDAPFRETEGMVARRRAEGCLVVEMESAGLMAVAQFRGVQFGQILYGGDDLSGPEWDSRDWTSVHEVRENLFWLAAEAALAM